MAASKNYFFSFISYLASKCISNDAIFSSSEVTSTFKASRNRGVLNKCLFRGARGVMVMELDTATRVQILDETDCISHSTFTLGKGINPIILPPPMGK